MSNRRKLRAPGRYEVHLRESGAPSPVSVDAKPIEVFEARAGGVVAAEGARRYRTRIISSDIQGSSGFYPQATLMEAARSKVFPAGTACYADHASRSEEADRPERSIRDLAGRLVTDAAFEGDGLYATVEVYPHWAPIIEAMRDSIGMSIRAAGTAEYGTQPEGTRGPLITALTEAYSVDFVTQAGAGGAIVSLVESARQAGMPVPLREAPASEIRDALQDVLDDTYQDPDNDNDIDCWVSVLDFDPDQGLVWYVTRDYGGGDADMWEQAFTTAMSGDVPVVALAADRKQVVARTVYVPAPSEDASQGETSASEAAVAEAAVSDTPWSNYKASDYTPEQYKRACLISMGDAKDDNHLPVRQPDGTLNRNGVHAAAGRLGSTKVPGDAKKAAAKKLVALYRNTLKEDPPDSLLSAAGMAESAAPTLEASDGTTITLTERELVVSTPDGLRRTVALAELLRLPTSALLAEADPAEGVAPDNTSDVTGGAPPAVPNPPDGEEPTVGTQNTGPAPGTAGTAETAALAEAQAANEQALREAKAKEEAAVKEAADLKERLARLEATEKARPVATAILAESGLPAAAQTRVLGSVCADVPLTDAHVLDEAAFKARVEEAAKAEATYLASLREAAGEGRVSGLGASNPAAPDPQARQDLTDLYKRRGLSEAAAKYAAAGRPRADLREVF